MSTIKTYATISSFRYRDNFSGYSIFNVIVADESYRDADSGLVANGFTKTVTCRGLTPEYAPGTPVYLEGEPLMTDKYGVQLELSEVRLETWDDLCLINFLQATCRGVGVSTATAIVRAFPNLLSLCKTPDASVIISNQISSISSEMAAVICQTICSYSVQRDVYDLLAPYGVKWGDALKVASRFGAKTEEELRRNPYELGKLCKVSFAVCDKLAKHFGHSASSPLRIKAAIERAFSTEQGRGNVCSDPRVLCTLAQKYIGDSGVYAERVPLSLIIETINKDQCFQMDRDQHGDEAIYTTPMLAAERSTATHIAHLLRCAKPLNYQEDSVEWAEKNCGIQYAERQKACFDLIRKTGVAIITGGPGTGKSTTLNGLIAAYERNNPKKCIVLCAPTGRAAQRMTETTGREATTIHRLLEYRPYGNDILHKTAMNPIEADMIVVDEASMLDMELSSIFLNAIPAGTLLIFLGDINQLPSVGAGNVLRDMIESCAVPTVQLSTVYRQGQQSPIVQNATRLNSGCTDFVITEEFELTTVNDVQNLYGLVIAQALRTYDPAHPFDMQILVPTHKGEVGDENLNTTLQDLLNPKNGREEYHYGKKVFRVNDKILMLNNNYAAGYFNGDVGLVTDVTASSIRVRIGDKELELGRSEMDDISLAYAMTIHKSQGSEFRHAIVVLPLNPANMLQRNLIYTAITRAKKTVSLLCEGDAVSISAATQIIKERKSRLKVRLNEIKKG